MRGRTPVVPSRCPAYSSHWNHIRISKASDMPALLATVDAARTLGAETQASMVRVKRYWGLPVAVTPAQALRQGRGEVRVWARKCCGAAFRGLAPAAEPLTEGDPPAHQARLGGPRP